MNKLAYLLLKCSIASLLILSIYSCSKDQKEVTLSAYLTPVENSSSKIVVDAFDTYWSNGDEVWVNNQSNCIINVSGNEGIATIAGISASDSYRAIFPSSIVREDDIANLNTIRVHLPSEQLYQNDGNGQQVQIPMGAYSNGRTLQFRNLCSLLKITVNNDNASSIELSSIEVSAMDQGVSLCGEGTAQVNGTAADGIAMDAGGCNWVSLIFPENNQPTLAPGASGSYYIVLPAFGSESAPKDVMITIFTTQGYSSQPLTGKYLPNNMIAAVSCNVSSSLVKPVPDNVTIPQGVIPGVYSIAANNEVFFSKGNLQFNAAQGTHAVASGGTKNGTWRFAEHQYDICGSNNQYISSAYDGWIDLFGWGTSGFDNTAVMTLATNFEPFSSNTSSSNYGPVTGYNLRGDVANYDWGVYNTISSAPNTTWRTMTISEWRYLMSFAENTRQLYASSHTEGGETKKMVYTKVTINGCNGVLLFPDAFVCPIHYECYRFQNATTIWNNCRQLSVQQFQQFEKRGCVFLPAAGGRNATNNVINWIEDYSLYWSTDYAGNNYPNNAKGILITSNQIQIASSSTYPRAYGGSVRLVHVISQ